MTAITIRPAKKYARMIPMDPDRPRNSPELMKRPMPMVPEIAIPRRTLIAGNIVISVGFWSYCTGYVMPAKTAIQRLARYEGVDITTTCF
jgi:hypothetical protein